MRLYRANASTGGFVGTAKLLGPMTAFIGEEPPPPEPSFFTFEGTSDRIQFEGTTDKIKPEGT